MQVVNHIYVGVILTLRAGRWEDQRMCVGNHSRIGVIPTVNGEVNTDEFRRINRSGRWEHQRMCVGDHTRLGVMPTLHGEVNNKKFQRIMKAGQWDH